MPLRRKPLVPSRVARSKLGAESRGSAEHDVALASAGIAIIGVGTVGAEDEIGEDRRR